MIRFDSLPVDVQQAMCTPMHRILPPAPATPTTNATHAGSLYLGSMAALYDLETLRAHNITNIVQVLDAPWYPFLSSENLDGVYRIDILDQSSADLKPHLEMACDHIGTLLNQGKNVLVHCQQVRHLSHGFFFHVAYLSSFAGYLSQRVHSYRVPYSKLWNVLRLCFCICQATTCVHQAQCWVCEDPAGMGGSMASRRYSVMPQLSERSLRSRLVTLTICTWMLWERQLEHTPHASLLLLHPRFQRPVLGCS